MGKRDEICMSITDWKLKRANGLEIAQVTSFMKLRDGTKIINRMYDGSYNIQTIGVAQTKATVKVYAASRSLMHAVNDAEASGELLTLVYQGEQYTGFIESAPSWTKFVSGRSYTGTFTFLIDEEK